MQQPSGEKTVPLPAPPEQVEELSRSRASTAEQSTSSVPGVSASASRAGGDTKLACRALSARKLAHTARRDARTALAEARELKRKAVERDFSNKEVQEASTESNRRLKERRGYVPAVYATAAVPSTPAAPAASGGNVVQAVDPPEWAQRLLSVEELLQPQSLVGSKLALYMRRMDATKQLWHEVYVGSAATSSATESSQNNSHDEGGMQDQSAKLHIPGVLMLTFTREKTDEMTPMSRLLQMARDGLVAIVTESSNPKH